MKRILLYTIIAVFILGITPACSEDTPGKDSILTVEDGFTTEFDVWLDENFVRQYNIQYMYKMKDIESDINYWLVPPDYDQAVKFAKIIKHALLGPYDEILGTTFLKQYFPKMIHINGNQGYRNNGTYIGGTADGGMKITLYGINDMDFMSWADLETQFHVCHHEFAHILHQTKMFSTEYREISGSDYLGDTWSDTSWQTALDLGFISTYSRMEYTEDFVEMYSYYIIWTADQWENYISRASVDGREKLERKLEILKDYFADTWGLDLDRMRELVQRRTAEIPQLDLDNL